MLQLRLFPQKQPTYDSSSAKYSSDKLPVKVNTNKKKITSIHYLKHSSLHLVVRSMN